SPTDRTDSSSTVDRRVRRSSFRVQFPLPLLLPCAVPSTIEGEDHSFLYHRRIHLKLPLPMMSPSIASAIVAITIQNFLYRCCYHPTSSATVVVV
ncbi:hypothetical protein BHE74_00010752, partial [Ensete ventricosum]